MHLGRVRVHTLIALRLCLYSHSGRPTRSPYWTHIRDARIQVSDIPALIARRVLLVSQGTSHRIRGAQTVDNTRSTAIAETSCSNQAGMRACCTWTVRGKDVSAIPGSSALGLVASRAHGRPRPVSDTMVRANIHVRVLRHDLVKLATRGWSGRYRSINIAKTGPQERGAQISSSLSDVASSPPAAQAQCGGNRRLS